AEYCRLVVQPAPGGLFAVLDLRDRCRRDRRYRDEGPRRAAGRAAAMTALALGPRPRILVIALRRLGDGLLTTPLIRSLRRAYTDARIETLVFADTAGILDRNPDLDAVVSMPPRPTALQAAALATRLFKRYDLAVSTQSGDRPIGFALLAGRR